MLSPKALIFSLLLLNATFLLISFLQQKLSQTQGIYNTYEPDIDSQQSSNYTFANPSLAYKVLSQLDVIKKPEGLKWMKRIRKSYLGIKPDDNYCDKHRAYFTEHPESIFEQINVVPTAKSGTFRTEVISSIANDLHGALNKQMTKKESRSFLHELKPETNIFFTTDALSLFFRVTQQMSCSFQESNQIPGQSKLSVKSKVAHAANDYIKKFEDRPHCMNHDKLFPQTYLLSNSAECKAFFENINSSEYQQLKEERRIVYIKKVPGVHRGLGVQPFTEEVEQKLKDSYKDGELC